MASSIKSSTRPSSARSGTSADDVDDDDFATVDETQLRLAQLQRNARNKGGKSKLMSKFKGLGEDEDREARLRFKRVNEAVTSILRLHNPVELSSICGQLGLKSHQKGPV